MRRRQDIGAVSPLSRPSPHERQVMRLVVEGESSDEVAGILSLSLKTVETHSSRLMQKLGIDDLPGLVKFAIKQGVDPAGMGESRQRSY